MNKPLKITGIVFGLLLLSVVGAAAALLVLVDPNDYKGEIAAAVERHTGRELTMEGEIGLTLFPWLALELERVSLADAPGFGDTPFAEVGRAELRVKLMPLLKKQVEMDTLVLHGLQLNLRRDAEGRANWQGLGGDKHQKEEKREAKEPAEGEKRYKIAALAIGGLDLRDATLRWDDRAAGAAYALEGVNLSTGALSPGVPMEVALDGRFSAAEPKVAGDLTLSARVTIRPVHKQLLVEGLKLDVNAAGDALPGGRAQLALAGKLAADGAKRAFDATGLELNLLGLPLRGEVHGAGERLTGKLDSGAFDPRPLLAALGSPLPEGATIDRASIAAQFEAGPKSAELKGLKFSLGELKGEGGLKLNDFAAPRYSGRIQAGYVDLRKLLPALGQQVPETSDPKALTKVGVRTTFQGDKGGVKLPKFEMAVDETHLQGGIRVTSFKAPATAFDLKVNAIDLDRYLPPPSAEGAAPAAEAAPAAAGNPLAPLLALDLRGRLAIGKLKAYGMNAESVSVVIKAKEGVVDVKPAKAKLYEGNYLGAIHLDARGQQPRFRLDKSLQAVRIGPLLRDLTGKEERVDGRGNVTLKLNGAGLEPEAVKRSLDGDVRFALRNGAVKGVNVAQMLREAHAKWKRQPAPPAGSNQTDFTELTGSVRIDKGVAVNRDLSAKSPLLRLSGEGRADLPNNHLDYGVQVKVVGTLKGQGGAGLKELKGITVPLRATGPFDDLSYKLDVSKVIKDRAKAKVKEKVKEQLGDKLKGILNR